MGPLTSARGEFIAAFLSWGVALSGHNSFSIGMIYPWTNCMRNEGCIILIPISWIFQWIVFIHLIHFSRLSWWLNKATKPFHLVFHGHSEQQLLKFEFNTLNQTHSSQISGCFLTINDKSTNNVSFPFERNERSHTTRTHSHSSTPTRWEKKFSCNAHY